MLTLIASRTSFEAKVLAVERQARDEVGERVAIGDGA
jgi:hypothetical protein